MSWTSSFFQSKDAAAKNRSSSFEKITLKISGMHCSSCVLSIDDALEALPGVKSANTHFAKGEIKIELDPEKNSIDGIKKEIENLGYSCGCD